MASLLLESVSQLLSRMATAMQTGDLAEVLHLCAGVSRRDGRDSRYPSQQIGGGRKRKIHLTFDDGPDPINTPQLLDELSHAGIQATFFVMGKKLETSLGQDLIHRAAAEGHQIGNHTYSHPHMTELTEDQIREEISKTEELIGDTSKGVKILRPPYGEHNALVDRVAEELGYRLVLWNVDSGDWDPKYQDCWVDHAMKQIMTQEESVVLAHDIQTKTVTRVGTFIAQIQNLSGSSFIRYSEALR